VQVAASVPLAGNYSADIHHVKQDTSSLPPHYSGSLHWNSVTLYFFEVMVTKSHRFIIHIQAKHSLQCPEGQEHIFGQEEKGAQSAIKQSKHNHLPSQQ